MRRIFVTVALIGAVGLAGGCERVKSATPLSPSIAGPIAGVEISQPAPVAPAEGARIATETQPVTLTVTNAQSNGQRPLSYLFEIAIDYNFTQKVFSQTGVAQGEGRTSVQLPQNLQPERQYFWRVKAFDGANEGDYMAPINFTVFTPIVIGMPNPVSPNNGVTLANRAATLVIQNAAVSGPAGAILYQFEIATDSSMASRVVSAEVGAGSAQTSYTSPELLASTTYFWRARAFDSGRAGDWTAVRSFVTPTPVVIGTPTPFSPGNGATLSSRTPTLMIQNAAVTGPAGPIVYQFEIATDSGMANRVVNAEVSAGSETTSYTGPELAAGTPYFWRARAIEAGRPREWSGTWGFVTVTPVVIGTPSPVSPSNGATLTNRTPTLVVQNASVTGPTGVIKYQFEIATDSGMTDRQVNAEVAAGNGQTSYTSPELDAAKTYFWRARAFDSVRAGGWSGVRQFTTAAPVVVTPPSNPPSGGGGPAPNDQIDLRIVTFVKGAPIVDWSVTSTLTSVYRSGADFCTEHTKSGRWPLVPFGSGSFIEGNQWFFASINGKWYGGANEYLRPGQVCKVIDGHVGEGGFGGTILESWTPKPGEIVGVAVSTPARAGQQGPVTERSNVILFRW